MNSPEAHALIEEKVHHDGHTHRHHQEHQHATATSQADAADMSEKNREHWDSMARSYSTEPWQQNMLNSIHAFLLSNLSSIPVPWLDPSFSFENAPSPNTTSSKPSTPPIRVLDYACGPGTITSILYAHASEFVGVDISPQMVAVYNERFSDSSPAKAHAHVANLIEPSQTTSSAQPSSFDLAAVGLGFHHFSDLESATSRLVSYLKPGGVFLIVDFVTHEVPKAGVLPAQHTVAHHGFGEDEVRGLFGRQGLGEVGVRRMEGSVLLKGRKDMERGVFVAWGRKADRA